MHSKGLDQWLKNKFNLPYINEILRYDMDSINKQPNLIVTSHYLVNLTSLTLHIINIFLAALSSSRSLVVRRSVGRSVRRRAL